MLVSTGNFPVTPRAYLGGKAADQQTIRKPEDLVILFATYILLFVWVFLWKQNPEWPPMGLLRVFFMHAA